MPSEIPPKKIQFARQLRREQTIYEKNLRDILRAHKMSGFHFRRQHPIGPFIADFACLKAKLIIELDGNSHDARQDYDANRDLVLGEWGWKISDFPTFTRATDRMIYGNRSTVSYAHEPQCQPMKLQP